MPLYIAQSGHLDRCYRCLTDRQTLKDRATQLLIKYKSGALVTQYFVHRFIKPGFQGSWELENVTWQNESSCCMMRWSEKNTPSLEVFQRLWMEGHRFTHLGEFFSKPQNTHCTCERGMGRGGRVYRRTRSFSQLYEVPLTESM